MFLAGKTASTEKLNDQMYIHYWDTVDYIGCTAHNMLHRTAWTSQNVYTVSKTY